MGAPELARVESFREKTGERRGDGLAEEQRERHPGARVRVDDAGGVAHAEDVARECAVPAKVNRLRDQRRPGDGRQPFEIPRKGATLSGEAREKPFEIVVGLMHNRARRQRCEVDETPFDAGKPHISPIEEMQNG